MAFQPFGLAFDKIGLALAWLILAFLPLSDTAVCYQNIVARHISIAPSTPLLYALAYGHVGVNSSYLSTAVSGYIHLASGQNWHGFGMAICHSQTTLQVVRTSSPATCPPPLRPCSISLLTDMCGVYVSWFCIAISGSSGHSSSCLQYVDTASLARLSWILEQSVQCEIIKV